VTQVAQLEPCIFGIKVAKAPQQCRSLIRPSKPFRGADRAKTRLWLARIGLYAERIGQLGIGGQNFAIQNNVLEEPRQPVTGTSLKQPSVLPRRHEVVVARRNKPILSPAARPKHPQTAHLRFMQ
jgi:hypothetical protein